MYAYRLLKNAVILWNWIVGILGTSLPQHHPATSLRAGKHHDKELRRLGLDRDLGWGWGWYGCSRLYRWCRIIPPPLWFGIKQPEEDILYSIGVIFLKSAAAGTMSLHSLSTHGILQLQNNYFVNIILHFIPFCLEIHLDHSLLEGSQIVSSHILCTF